MLFSLLFIAQLLSPALPLLLIVCESNSYPQQESQFRVSTSSESSAKQKPLQQSAPCRLLDMHRHANLQRSPQSLPSESLKPLCIGMKQSDLSVIQGEAKALLHLIRHG
jgi:hypothetical protein